MRIIAPEIDSRGDAREWIGHVKCKNDWYKIVKRKEQRQKGQFEPDANDDEDEIVTTLSTTMSNDNEISSNNKCNVTPGR